MNPGIIVKHRLRDHLIHIVYTISHPVSVLNSPSSPSKRIHTLTWPPNEGTIYHNVASSKSIRLAPNIIAGLNGGQQIIADYKYILTKWPKDALRPERSFTALIEKRVANPPIPFRKEEGEIKAAQQLLDNAFTKRFTLPQNLLRPQSNPDHYEALRKEIDEVPTRTWWQNTVKRLTGMVRLQ